MNKDNAILLDKHKDILSFRDLSVKTVATYVSYMTSYIQWVEDELPGRFLDSVTWDEIRSYVRFLKKIRKLNPRTINVHLSQLRDFYFYVLHKDWDMREVPNLKFDTALPKVPTKDQVLSLINATDNPKHKAELALLYSSGMRVSELCRLHCGDIYHSKGQIYISRSKNRSDRYSILSEKAFEDLKVYVRSAYPGASKGSWLFPGRGKSGHVSEESVRKVLAASVARLGMTVEGYTLHSLRHAFGLHLYESGADLMSIKEALGHKSLSSTEIYLTLGIGNGRNIRSPYDDD